MIDTLPTGRTLVMGILNVTADSFSDGGRWLDTDTAIARGLELVAEGADIVDVGGESTRPGSERVTVEVELDRVMPVVKALAKQGVCLSVDTTRAEVADAVLKAGATWINDVSGGLAEPEILNVTAAHDAGFVSMHWRGHATEMDANAVYDDVVAEVVAEMAERRDAALAAGIDPRKLVMDPGIGFAKIGDQNWDLINAVEAMHGLGFPLLMALSRKKFLGALLADDNGPRPPAERDDATVALTTFFALQGVWGVRTHTARQHRDAIAVAQHLGAPHPFGIAEAEAFRRG